MSLTASAVVMLAVRIVGAAAEGMPSPMPNRKDRGARAVGRGIGGSDRPAVVDIELRAGEAAARVVEHIEERVAARRTDVGVRLIVVSTRAPPLSMRGIVCPSSAGMRGLSPDTTRSHIPADFQVDVPAFLRGDGQRATGDDVCGAVAVCVRKRLVLQGCARALKRVLSPAARIEESRRSFRTP